MTGGGEVYCNGNRCSGIDRRTCLPENCGELFFPAYDPAADLFAGVAGGLSGEVIPPGMNDDGFSYNILDCKAFVVKGRPDIALVSEQGNHVAGMFRMDGVGRIEMTAGFFERAGAVSVLVDMHSVEIGRILRGNIGKSEYFRFYEDSFVGGAVKLDESA